MRKTIKIYGKIGSLIFFSVFLIFSIAGSLSSQAGTKKKNAEDIYFRLPEPQILSAGKGIRVYYLEDKDLPFVRLEGYFKGGSLYQPADKAGLASLVAEVMRSGGTEKMPGSEIDAELEFLAAKIEFEAKPEFFRASLVCLDRHFPRVLQVFSDLLRSPRFDQEKINSAKNRMKEAVRTRWDDPRQTALTLFDRYFYGVNSPEVLMPTFLTLEEISRDDLIQFHQKWFVPNNLILGIAGNISLKEAKRICDDVFEDWQPRDVDFPEIAESKERPKNIVYCVSQNLPEAVVAMGHAGIQRANPDWPKIEVLNSVLGGNISASRLKRELTVKNDFASDIRGHIGAGRERGKFLIYATLKPESLGKALKVIKEALRDVQTQLIPDDELEKAKKALIHEIVFQFRTKLEIVRDRIVRVLTLGQTPENTQERIEKIAKVTSEEIRAAAQKYLQPEMMITVIVGNKEKFDIPLENLGKAWDISVESFKKREQFVLPKSFDVSVKNPAFEKGKGPGVLFDEAHNNYHTAAGRYKTFVDIITNDGYVVTPSKAKFSTEVLKGHDIVVIANALDNRTNDNWSSPEFTSAFAEDEIKALHDWVKKGGALLLIADHEPFGGVAYDLAAKFGVFLSKGTACDPEGLIVHSRTNGKLLDHPITNGRNENEKVNTVVAFTGESLQAPEGSGFLKLSEKAYDIEPATKAKRPVPGHFQGAALAYGSGRLVVMGEAGMLSAQATGFTTGFGGSAYLPLGMNAQNNYQENKKLLLNILHYLSGLLEPGSRVSEKSRS